MSGVRIPHRPLLALILAMACVQYFRDTTSQYPPDAIVDTVPSGHWPSKRASRSPMTPWLAPTPSAAGAGHCWICSKPRTCAAERLCEGEAMRLAAAAARGRGWIPSTRRRPLPGEARETTARRRHSAGCEDRYRGPRCPEEERRQRTPLRCLLLLLRLARSGSAASGARRARND